MDSSSRVFAYLLLLVVSCNAAAADCSPYNTALDDLTSHLQRVLSYVQSLVPYGGPPCGGLLGSGIDSGSWIATLRYRVKEAGDSGADEDYLGQPSLANDPQNCCAICVLRSQCVYWTHVFLGADTRCVLYKGFNKVTPGVEPTEAPEIDQPPIFFNSYGYRTIKDRISGKIPRGMWGAAGDPKGNDYILLRNGERFRNPTPGGAPVLAEGWEYCDFMGAFKHKFYTDGSNNGKLAFTHTDDALECCSLCVRNVYADGNPLIIDGPSGNGAAGSCVYWSFDAKIDSHACVLRDPVYHAYGLCGVDMTCYQNFLECSMYKTAGMSTIFTRPDGSDCGSTIAYNQWSSGFSTFSG